MRRFAWLLAVLVVWALGSPQLASAGLGCCVCSSCSTAPTTCTGPDLSCDITCSQFGCSGFMLGDSGVCMTLPPCNPPSLITNPAPTASSVGLGAVAAALAALGIRRLVRRPRGAGGIAC